MPNDPLDDVSVKSPEQVINVKKLKTDIQKTESENLHYKLKLL